MEARPSKQQPEPKLKAGQSKQVLITVIRPGKID